MIDFFKQIINLFGFILYPLFFVVFLFAFSFVIYFLYYRIKFKVKLQVNENIVKPESKFERLFIQFPIRLVIDLFNRDPYEFKEFGLHMFCGEQGSGKTTALVHKVKEMQRLYPKCKVRTNMNYKFEDEELLTWEQLIQNENGIYGQVEVLDEIQTWFSSNDSKNFPPEMLTEISQQRKQKKAIFGTAQVFSRISKQIREQTSFVYCPITIAGCLTIVRVTKPKFWNDEKQVFTKFIKTYFFVHTTELRESFDTLKKINRYKSTGFKDIKYINQE